MSKPPPLSKDDKYLMYLSLLFGSAAALAYPAAVSHPRALILAFGTPMAMATTARLKRDRKWQSAAIIVGLATLLAIMVAIATGGAFFAEVILIGGPPVALFVVGRMVRDRDKTAAAAWVLLNGVGYLIGLALVMTGAGTSGLAPAFVAAGTLFAGLRLARSPKLSS
ncbi:MAG: hypothetical protein WD152_01745 [Nitriliruptoraceae bacterium]